MSEVLETTKFVVQNSDFIKIDQERVRAFAQNFKHETRSHWLAAAPFDFLHLSDEDKLHLIFITDALSFCFWGEPKWAIEYNGQQHDGAWGSFTALYQATQKSIPILDFSFCAEMRREDLAQMFRGNTEIPLFAERLNIAHEIGATMIKKYHGRVANLIQSAQSDAQKLLAAVLHDFPSFNDSSPYKDKTIYFHKRAQLFVADIYQVFDGHDYGALKNIDTLTAPADYKLPQILRKHGILIYYKDLAEKIDNKIELARHSPEEVEIRANTIWAIEHIKEELNERYPHILPFEIGDHLWLATQQKYPDDKPYHRTRTTAY